MKVAVCLSGQPRKVSVGHSYIRASLLDYDVDYYSHLWYHKDDIGKELKFYSGWDEKVADRIVNDVEEQFLDLYSPKKYIFEPQLQFIDNHNLIHNHGRQPVTTQPPSVFISMLYSKRMAFELILNTGINYDVVIITRTDFCPIKRFDLDLDLDYMYFAYVDGPEWNTTCINDVMSISNTKNADIYTNLYHSYKEIYDSGIQFCAHRLAMGQLIKNNVKSRSIMDKDWKLARINDV